MGGQTDLDYPTNLLSTLWTIIDHKMQQSWTADQLVLPETETENTDSHKTANT